jgi:hypothetical protein
MGHEIGYNLLPLLPNCPVIAFPQKDLLHTQSPTLTVIASPPQVELETKGMICDNPELAKHEDEAICQL